MIPPIGRGGKTLQLVSAEIGGRERGGIEVTSLGPFLGPLPWPLFLENVALPTGGLPEIIVC